MDSRSKTATPSEQIMPGGTKARQRTVTATITGIDMSFPSITFTGPNGLAFTSKVQDTEDRQGEGRRQGRYRLDRSAAGVARARCRVLGLGRSAVIAPDRRRGALKECAVFAKLCCGVHRHVLARSRRLRQRCPRGRVSRRRHRPARRLSRLRSHRAECGLHPRPDLRLSLQSRGLPRLVSRRSLSCRPALTVQRGASPRRPRLRRRAVSHRDRHTRRSASPAVSPLTVTTRIHRAAILWSRGSYPSSC